MTDYQGNDGRSLGSMVLGLGHSKREACSLQENSVRVGYKYKNKNTYCHSFLQIFRGMKTEFNGMGRQWKTKQRYKEETDRLQSALDVCKIPANLQFRESKQYVVIAYFKSHDCSFSHLYIYTIFYFDYSSGLVTLLKFLLGHQKIEAEQRENVIYL